MRVDKFLKLSRLIKRRTLAKEVAENERVLVNDKVVKPSKEIHLGDKITIEFGNKIVCKLSYRLGSADCVLGGFHAASWYKFDYHFVLRVDELDYPFEHPQN